MYKSIFVLSMILAVGMFVGCGESGGGDVEPEPRGPTIIITPNTVEADTNGNAENNGEPNDPPVPPPVVNPIGEDRGQEEEPNPGQEEEPDPGQEEEQVVEEPIKVIKPVGGPPPQREIDKLRADQKAAITVFKKGSRVFVRNVGDLGLVIRHDANGDQIGGMFDNETGTITGHPKISEGLAWFFIEWDPPVKDPRSGCGDRDICMGWSVAVTPNRLKVLNLIK